MIDLGGIFDLSRFEVVEGPPVVLSSSAVGVFPCSAALQKGEDGGEVCRGDDRLCVNGAQIAAAEIGCIIGNG